MRKSRLFAASSVLLASAALLAACGSKSSSSSSKPQKLAWTEAAELTTMDPSKATDRYDADQFNNVMEGLIRLSNKAKATPGMAKSWKESADGKTWTFNLRKGAKWSNGDEVTANDFVYSWRRTVDPKTASEYAYLFSGIKNADAIVAGKKKDTALGVKADGKYKLVVTLDRRIPYFKLLMGFYIFFPQNQKFVEKCGSKYGTAAKYVLSNGPFKMTGWTGTNLSWKLKKSNTYWDKKNVKLDEVSMSVQKTQTTSYNLYQSGKLDAALLDTQAAKQLKGKKGYTVLTMGNTTYLTYNFKYKMFRNVNLRRAISLALNRKQLISTIGDYNTQAKSFSATNAVLEGRNFAKYVESHDAAGNKYLDVNKAAAKKYFAKALKELGVKKLSFNLLGDDDDVYKKETEFIQSALSQTFGSKLSVSVTNLPKETRLSRQSAGNFQVFLGGLTSDFPDPYHFLSYLTTDQPYNFGKWSNASYDQAIKASLTMDKDKRQAALLKAERIIADQQPITTLFHLGQAWMIRANVKGVVFNGEYPDFKHAYAVKN